MENKSWTVTYRNRDNGQRITAAVFAVDQQQAREKAKADGREAWKSKVSNQTRKRWRGFSLPNLPRSSRADTSRVHAVGR